MQIPGFKKIAESQPVSPAVKPLPSLVVIDVMRSRNLMRFYRFFYFCFSACVLAVIFPRLAELPWLLVVIVLAIPGAGILCRQQIKKIFVGKMWVEQSVWQLHGNQFTGSYVVAAEVRCWPLIVLLPLRHQQTGKRIYLALARDSLSPADNASLRTWLRVCLRPKT